MNEVTTPGCDGECPSGPKKHHPQAKAAPQFLRDDESWYLSYPQDTENSTYFLPFIPGKQNFDV